MGGQAWGVQWQFAEGAGDSDTIALAVGWTKTCRGDRRGKKFLCQSRLLG